jgi:hypothetical protein
MSEFYEVMTPHMVSILKKLDLFPMECMICYDPCDIPSTVAVLPCFHMIHISCAQKAIEMAFRNAIHPNTILPTWEFHCPQFDSEDSLRESARHIKQALGRKIKPSIPRCEQIPIPNQDIESISYFSLPFVKEWYQKHSPISPVASVSSILILFGILYLFPQPIFIAFLCYQLFRLVREIRHYTNLLQTVGTMLVLITCYQIHLKEIE